MDKITPTQTTGGGDCGIIRVRLPDGRYATFDLEVFQELERLGVSLRFSARTNSGASPHDYVKVNALLPRPDKGGRYPTHQAARLVIALGMLDEEARDCRRHSDARWRVEYLDGDHLNLRRGNLRRVPATRAQRGGFYELWDLRERRKLVAKGLNPNVVFRERRKDAEARR